MEEMTIEMLKNKLYRHYNQEYGGSTEVYREFIEMFPATNDNDVKKGIRFFALDGTPPKGYALIIDELKVICLYDVHGKRFKNYHNTVLS